MRYDITSVVEVVINLSRAILIVVLLKAGYGLVALAMVTLALAVVRLALVMLLAFKYYPDLKLALRFVEIIRLKQVFNYSVYKFIASLGDLLRFNLDSIVIASLISVASITPYAIAQNLIRYFMNFVAQIFSVTTPLYSSYEAKDQMESIRNLLLKSTFYSALISFFVAAMFIIYGFTFISLWVGAQYAQAGYPVLVILVVSFSLALSQNPTIVAAYGIEKHKVLAFVTIGEGILNLILSLILAARMGLIGVALGTAIPMVLTKAIIQPIYICRVLDQPIGSYVVRCFLKPVSIVVLFVLVHLFMKNRVELNSFYSLAGASIISGVLFIVITFLFFSGAQRAYWLGYLSQLKQVLSSKVTV